MIFLVLIFLFAYADSIGEWSGDTIADKWRIQAKNNIDAVLKKRRNTNIAKKGNKAKQAKQQQTKHNKKATQDRHKYNKQ